MPLLDLENGKLGHYRKARGQHSSGDTPVVRIERPSSKPRSCFLGAFQDLARPVFRAFLYSPAPRRWRRRNECAPPPTASAPPANGYESRAGPASGFPDCFAIQRSAVPGQDLLRPSPADRAGNRPHCGFRGAGSRGVQVGWPNSRSAPVENG